MRKGPPATHTGMMTDDASTKNIPDEINNGKNIPVQAAIAANARDPVPPINTDALYPSCKRKPTRAPAIDAPNIARSGLKCQKLVTTEEVSRRSKVHYSTYLIGVLCRSNSQSARCNVIT